MVAITDSIMAAGLQTATINWASTTWWSWTGDAKLAVGGSRAGSTLTTGTALKNVLQYTGRSLQEILPMFTENPAKLIGVYDRVGSLNPGKLANMLVLDEDCGIERTYVRGVCRYRREA